jgi:predicted RNase H-like HicB family nuclease
MKYLVVIEKSERNYSVYSPDVPGCAATGKTVEETLQNMKEALEFHLEGISENGEELPKPKGLSFYLSQTDEISNDEILAHIELELPELALA